jgi:hypothetical protein
MMAVGETDKIIKYQECPDSISVKYINALAVSWGGINMSSAETIIESESSTIYLENVL